MCFRPAATVNIVKCLDCGAFNKPTDTTCKKCGADLAASLKAAQDAIAPDPGAPKPDISLTPKGLDDKPKVPGAPPAVPTPPKTPGA